MPNTTWKINFDLYIVVLLLIVTILLPYQVAFVENEPMVWKVVNGIIDVSFLIDMVLVFFTAYYDNESSSLVTDKKTIAVAYL